MEALVSVFQRKGEGGRDIAIYMKQRQGLTIEPGWLGSHCVSHDGLKLAILFSWLLGISAGITGVHSQARPEKISLLRKHTVLVA